MVLSKVDRETLNKIVRELHENPAEVNNLLPKLSDVLLCSDITRIKHRLNTDGVEWAANDMLMYYQLRATNLQPMVKALQSCGLHHTANLLIAPNAMAAAPTTPPHTLYCHFS